MFYSYFCSRFSHLARCCLFPVLLLMLVSMFFRGFFVCLGISSSCFLLFSYLPAPCSLFCTGLGFTVGLLCSRPPLLPLFRDFSHGSVLLHFLLLYVFSAPRLNPVFPRLRHCRLYISSTPAPVCLSTDGRSCGLCCLCTIVCLLIFDFIFLGVCSHVLRPGWRCLPVWGARSLLQCTRL